MPAYRTQVTHRFSRDESIDRLKRTAAKIGSTCALAGSWEDGTYTFSAKVQGIGLSGRLRVEDGALHLDASLPLIALPFKGWFPRILSTALEMGGESNADGSTPAAAVPADPAKDVLLFLHIPKAGGSTLGEYVYNQCRDPQGLDEGLVNSGVYFCPFGFFREPGLAFPEEARVILRRPDLRAVIGHFWYGLHREIGRPCRYVTLLRDPVDRVVSLYFYLKLEGQMSLEEFATNPPYKEVENDQTRRIAGVDPEVGGCDEATLQLAIDNLQRDFAVVGTVERLDETLANLRSSFGWTAEVACVTRNANSDRPALASLAAETIAAIRARNELDNALFAHVNTLMDSLPPRPLPCNT